MTLAQALTRHKFRRVGVETHVTSRGDVEAAFAHIQPIRIRNANKLWLESYPSRSSDDACPTDGAMDDCGSRRVHFPESDGALVVVECFEVDDDASLKTPAIWSLGAGVAKAYREQLRLRIQEEEDISARSVSDWPPLPLEYNPDHIWSVIEKGQAFLPPTLAWTAAAGGECCIPERRPGFVRFVCISDTHKRHREFDTLPEGDVLLHAGDFTLAGKIEQVEDFGSWIGSQNFERKFVIAGNHDVTLDPEFSSDAGAKKFPFNRDVSAESVREAFARCAGKSVTYLEDSEVSFRGIRVYGAPWQPAFGTWAFQKQRGPPMAEQWRQIPSGVDVVLVHGPPLGRGDLCNNGMRAGCADLLAEIQGRIRPAVCVSGHIHEAAGMSFDGITHYLNASSLGFGMSCIEHAPMIFDLPAQDVAADSG